MKKLSLLIVFTVLAIASCSKPQTSNVSTNNQANNQAELRNSANVNSISLTNNSNLTNSSEPNPAANSNLLKQIEAQQLETADPRKVTKENKSNTNQSPKKTVPAGQQN